MHWSAVLSRVNNTRDWKIFLLVIRKDLPTWLMSHWFLCDVVSLTTIPMPTVEWIACFGVPMHSACVNQMVDILFSHEILRRCFAFSFFLFCFFVTMYIIFILFSIFFLLLFLDDAFSWSLSSVSSYSSSPVTIFLSQYPLSLILYVIILNLRRFKYFHIPSYHSGFEADMTRQHDTLPTEQSFF